MQGNPAARPPIPWPTAVVRVVEWVVVAAFVLAVYETVVAGGLALWPEASDNWILLLWIAAAAICGFSMSRVRSTVRSLAARVWPAVAAEPYATLAASVSKAVTTTTVEDALPRLAFLVGAGTGARQVEVWLADDDGLRCAARHPARNPAIGEPTGPRTVATLADLAALSGVDHVVPVTDSGDVLGALLLVGPDRGFLTPHDLRLAADVANAAGLLLRNAELGNRLRERIRLESEQAGDMDVSRRRLVAARDAAREQLSREIQAEVCDALVRSADEMAALRDRVDDAALNEALTAMAGEIDAAIGRFRRIVHGVYPAALTDHGLLPALDNLTAELDRRTSVRASELPRFSAQVESGVYFCVAAILRAWPDRAAGSRDTDTDTDVDSDDRIRIRLNLEDRDLVLTVHDPAAQHGAHPAGVIDPLVLEAALDRIAALDGSFESDMRHPGLLITIRVPVSAAPRAEATQ